MDDKVKELVDKVYASYDKIFNTNINDILYLIDEIKKLAANAERENFTNNGYNVPFYAKGEAGIDYYIKLFMQYFDDDHAYNYGQDRGEELGKRIFGSEYYNLIIIGLGFKFGDLMVGKLQEMSHDDFKYYFEATARAVTAAGGIVIDIRAKEMGGAYKTLFSNLGIHGIEIEDLATMPMENLVSGNFQIQYLAERPRGKQPETGTVAFKDLAQELKEIRDTLLKKR